ncbi:hypothetical protein T11_15685 [Trichinella zimbabwensis]|uniref:Uncharacterized protein n=1 Tax=Trichinella zimbabwensis TaxID=268475 RepID=A0A0V1I4H9_9BILA|nr:hypothetical protein T11_15685 [Trichinella zimbabwensis]
MWWKDEFKGQLKNTADYACMHHLVPLPGNQLDNIETKIMALCLANLDCNVTCVEENRHILLHIRLTLRSTKSFNIASHLPNSDGLKLL